MATASLQHTAMRSRSPIRRPGRWISWGARECPRRCRALCLARVAGEVVPLLLCEETLNRVGQRPQTT